MNGGYVLRSALDIIKRREAMYGPPSDHFARTAMIATALLRHKLQPGETINAEDWARLMIGDKLVRDLGPDGGTDQPIDIAGYADALGRLRPAPPAPTRPAED